VSPVKYEQGFYIPEDDILVNTLLSLLDFCNQSSFHQCSTQRLFIVESSPDIEPVTQS
jgi:hypothetical protein